MAPQLRPRRSWADLPPELLSIIVDFFQLKSSLLKNFRSVCKSWLSVVPLRLHPFLPLSINFDNPLPPFIDSDNGQILVVSTGVYIIRRRGCNPLAGNNSWLVAIEQPTPDKLQLLHPLTRQPFEDLPETVPNLLSKFDVIPLSKGFNLRLCDGITPVLKPNNNRFTVNKVILWLNPKSESREPKNYSVMVLHDSGELVCFRLSNCNAWVTRMDLIHYVDDIVIWKGLAWGVGRRNGRLFGIEYSSLRLNYVAAEDSEMGGQRRYRLLLDFKGELHLVCSENVYFKVYKLNKRHVWEKVESLGDKILFVSFDTCFFARERDIPGCQGNCVVYPKDCSPYYLSPFIAHENFLFGGASAHLQVGVRKYGENRSFRLISVFPELSALFWPPPHWIWEDTSTPLTLSQQFKLGCLTIPSSSRKVYLPNHGP